MSTDTPSHIGTQWLRTKSPADWLTRTASRLSTRWVWAKGCIYFQGIYGPCCAPATHTSTSQDTRTQGLQVAAHGKRAGWDKVCRCRVLSGPPYNPDQPEPTPSDNQGLWGSGVDIFPQRSHTYRGRRMPMGVTSNWCHPQGHHARRPPTTVPIFLRRSHTYRGRRMPMGVTSNWCHPQGHHARRLSTGEERNAPRLRRRPWLWTASSLANAVLEANP